MATASPEPRVSMDLVEVPDVGPVELRVEERAGPRPYLLLHGGAGPVSWARFAPTLAARSGRGVLLVTNPGFARTPRPDGLRTIRGLADLYAAFLQARGVTEVTVLGSSVGGWVAAEMAALAPPQLHDVVLIGAAGIEVPGLSIPDVSTLNVAQVMALSYHDPKPFAIDPATLTDDQRAVIASNRAAMAVYAPTMTDPTLAARLARVTLPCLVFAGDSDRIVPADFGRAYAAAIPGARFVLLPKTGHLPQIESPELLLETLGVGPGPR